jgi:subfamily B ATP-binding cassette protein MsbA
MQLKFENTFWGYLQFYFNILGYRMILAILLSIIVSIIDGFALAMFIPLLQSTANGATSSQATMGNLHYFTAMIENLGFSLTLKTVLCIIVLMFIIKGLFKILELGYQARILHFFMKKVRHDLVSNFQSLSYKGFLQLDAGIIQNTFIAEVQRMSQAAKGYITSAQAL